MKLKQWWSRSLRILAMSGAVLCIVALTMEDAAAVRLGGGRSIGRQSSGISQQRQAMPPPSSAPQAAPSPAPASAPSPGNRWLGPLAGLAAGLGLAALFSHFGMGGEFSNFILLALMIMAGLFVVSFLLRKLAGNPAPRRLGYQAEYHTSYLGQETVAGPAPQATEGYRPPNPLTEQHPVAASALSIPAGFDKESFVHSAKVVFLRLQAAFDAGNQDDLREFTSPEMFAELKLQLQERGSTPQKTDVVTINADLLTVETQNNDQLASVRFSGLLREETEASATPIDEVWNFARPSGASGGWVLAGIQQLN